MFYSLNSINQMTNLIASGCVELAVILLNIVSYSRAMEIVSLNYYGVIILLRVVKKKVNNFTATET